MKLRVLALCAGVAVLAFACPFDMSLREYLDARFWLPFAKSAANFERPNVRRVNAAFAGMRSDHAETSLCRLRDLYQLISVSTDAETIEAALTAARTDRSLTAREREEIDLIDAKIDLRRGNSQEPDLLRRSQKKLEKFLQSARTPEFRSEARGWLARTYYLLGNQTAAGKIYLDELNRAGSNLSEQTLLNSLQIVYGYDGGPELRRNLPDYFDTAEHAAFAVELTTNPRWDRYDKVERQERANEDAAKQYARIRGLLDAHAELFRSAGADRLALLTMRTALRMGDPAETLRLSQLLPADAGVRQSPDFLWLLGSAAFLSHDFAAAEAPLLALFRSKAATSRERHAAAYGLCGVYRKTNNRVEQIRFALWLGSDTPEWEGPPITHEPGSDYQAVYWDASGWDLALLLETEASIGDLQAFLDAYPAAPKNRVVRYALAVRLARENRYAESADIYASIHAYRRAARMRQLNALYIETQRSAITAEESRQVRYRLAEFIGSHEDGIYFNDSLWEGFQRYALTASKESGFTAEERQTAILQERQLKDDQEERWRAWLILRGVVADAGKSPLGRKAALLALDDLARISDRFGREADIQSAKRELRRSLRQ
jgi:hypothetical protein